MSKFKFGHNSKKFESAKTNIDNEEPRRPSNAVDEQLWQLVEDNPCTIISERAQEMGVNTGTVWGHLSLIGKSKKLDKTKKTFTKSSLRFFCVTKRTNFLIALLTCDEKLIIYDNLRCFVVESGWISKAIP